MMPKPGPTISKVEVQVVEVWSCVISSTFRGGAKVSNYTSSPGQEQKNILPAFVTRLLTSRSRKSGYGLLLGCRSGFDAGHEKNFFSALPPQKTVKTSSGGRARHRNRSGVVELVGREPWIIARVENGVCVTKIFAAKRKTVKRQNVQKKWIRKTVFSGEFSFFGRGKTNFWGGV